MNPVIPPLAGAYAGDDALLTLNSGSSSLKFALFDALDESGLPHADGLQLLLSGQIDGLGGAVRFQARSADGTLDAHEQWPAASAPADAGAALRWLIDWLRRQVPGRAVVAVGHRVVHGGLHHAEPVLLTDAVVARLQALVPLAPLHQPHNLAGVAAARQAFGAVPQVACFDTAFHRHHPFVNDCFALPRRFFDAGVRRYGFHGLSYEYIAQRLAEQHAQQHAGRVVVAHLGNGASMCALQGGRSVASTMGFSALDGLPMGTRCGQIDPGVLLYLMQHEGLDADQVADLLYKQSGLKGLSGGLSHDMRTLEAAGTPEAAQAIDYFVFRIRRELGGLAAVLQGLDAVVFTGGIGENSALIRERVLEGMGWLGIRLDAARNRAGATVISSDDSPVLCLRLPTNEEGMIAQQTLRTAALGRRPAAAAPTAPAARESR
ncbi:acetate/propionate family kinase [Aquabacterium sp. OR-4]|uniref:acetate/propionate family kinase n=1 Tax=Aquabacterium sp. OR-4 TaxID=2978127 RepID=UPI0021B1BA22|nr:acetate/propionate family kinase [Aquabacterium sp. OR-4]MDT7837103.1 acetate/propionate family kinase [Aquabacterium sp. OR-4]